MDCPLYTAPRLSLKGEVEAQYGEYNIPNTLRNHKNESVSNALIKFGMKTKHIGKI